MVIHMVRRAPLLALLLFAATALGGGGEPSQAVSVPVILDGVRHLTPEEFNAMYAELRRGPEPLGYILLRDEPDRLYVFTSASRMREYLSARGIRPPAIPGPTKPTPQPAASTATNSERSVSAMSICYIDGYASTFYEHVQCDGASLSYGPTGSEPDLRSWGFNDRISSLTCSSHPWVDWCTMWEHVFYDGAWISFQSNQAVGSFDGMGWNDRASSLLIQGN